MSMNVQKQWPHLKPRRGSAPEGSGVTEIKDLRTHRRDAREELEIDSEIKPKTEKQEVQKDVFADMRKDLEHSLEVVDTVSATHALDKRFFQGIWAKKHSLRERLEKFELAEALTSGKEVSRENLGSEGSENEVSRCVFEENVKVVAYVKTQSGEGGWRYDEGEKKVYKILRSVDKKKNTINVTEELYLTETASNELLRIYHSDTSTEEQKGQALYKYHIWKALSERGKQLPHLKKSVSIAYGISPDEVPLTDELTPRKGIEAGSMPMREYTVSRIDAWIGFDTVPLTVLRTQSYNQDLASVQQAVESADPKQPAKPFSINDFESFQAQGKRHPGAKSLMRIACLHYIVKSVDAHAENLLIDPVTKKVTSIDNGLSLGLQSVEMDEKGEPILKNGKVVRKNMDPYRSLAMEVIADHDDWTLDDEAMGELKRIHKATLQYLALRETGPQRNVISKDEEEFEQDDSDRNDEEIKFIIELFRQLYGNEKIASVEAQYFFARIGEIIRHGKPPVKELLEKKDLFILKGHIT